MVAVNRCPLITAAFLSISALCGHAQGQGETVERQINVASGHDSRIGVYTNVLQDCTAGPLPSVRLVVAPAHGTVKVRRGRLKATNYKQCLAMEVPALIAVYRTAAEFIKSDQFELEITAPAGKKQLQHFRVNVSSSSGGGQGI